MLKGFLGSPITPVKFPGIPGDVGAARKNLLDSIDTDYVFMVDPDDLADPVVILEELKFLQDNPSYSMCGCREKSIYPCGRTMYVSASLPFSMDKFKKSPLELHNGTVMRMSMIREVMPILRDVPFYSFEWALKLALASLHPVEKLDRIGYTFRRKPKSHHHALSVPDHMIHPRDTVSTLISLGFPL